jgi:transposase
VAPSLVPVRPGERVKTDRRDAAKRARFLRSGHLTPIHVPDPATGAIRDLERARDAARRAERGARRQPTKSLLRQGRRFEGRTGWGPAHLARLAERRFDDPAPQAVIDDYREAVELATARVARLAARLAGRVATWGRAPSVAAPRALRGVDPVTAATLVAEVEGSRRFPAAPGLMSFVGLVPSGHPGGGSRRQGRITRTGHGQVRRALVEAARHDRREPRMSAAIRERDEEVSAGVRAIAGKARRRLHKRMCRLTAAGEPTTRAVTAVARELVGFVWAIAREEVLRASPASAG